MASQVPSNDVRRDLEASLAARRELGPEYDDHFIDTLTERLVQRARREMRNTPAPQEKLTPEMRVAVAICSLIFGIPLVAIAAGAGFAALVLVCLMILGINFAASR